MNTSFKHQWTMTIKTQTVKADQKIRPKYMLSTRNKFIFKDTERVKGKRWRNIYCANTNQSRMSVATLISDIPDFKARRVTRDKKRHYIMIKQSIL